MFLKAEMCKLGVRLTVLYKYIQLRDEILGPYLVIFLFFIPKGRCKRVITVIHYFTSSQN